MPSSSRVAAVLVFVLAFAPGSRARAQPTVDEEPAPEVAPIAPPPRDGVSAPIIWDPAWGRVGTADYVVTGVSAGIALATAIAPPLPRHAYGGVLFDESIRNSLRMSAAQSRYTARDTSDVLLSLTATWPFFVDAVITTWWYRDSPDVAYQMAVIDTEAMAIAGALQGVTNGVVSRERPYGRDCGSSGLPEETNDCSSPSRYRSFFSGHSVLTFTSAGLLCSHHMHLGLNGPAVDITTCVTGYVAAAATATLRVAGDMHYATDVLTGMVVGTAVGLVVPAIHYARRRREEPGGASTGGLDLRVVPLPNGVSLVGAF